MGEDEVLVKGHLSGICGSDKLEKLAEAFQVADKDPTTIKVIVRS